MSELHCSLVTNHKQALDIAAVRNSGREFMTHDQREITPAEQLNWYDDTYLPAFLRRDMFAFSGYADRQPAAYGLINRRDGDYWLTGVIAPEFQGNGYGRQLFMTLGSYVLENLDDHVMLDVLADNDRAHNLYRSLGYMPVKQAAGLITMELAK